MKKIWILLGFVLLIVSTGNSQTKQSLLKTDVSKKTETVQGKQENQQKIDPTKKTEVVQVNQQNEDNSTSDKCEKLYEKFVDKQVILYGNALKFLIGLITFLGVVITILVAAGWVQSYKDRREMKKVREKLTYELKNEIQNDIREIREEMRKEKETAVKTINHMKEEITAMLEEIKEQKSIAEKYTGEIAKYKENILQIPTGIKTEKEARKLLEEGNEFYTKQNYESAINKYTEALVQSPNSAGAYYNRGLAYYYKGDLDEAIRDYDKAITIDPDDADALNNRGLAYRKKEEFDKAIQDYDKAIHINPDYAKAMANMGTAYKLKEDKEKAKFWWNEAMKRKEFLPDKGERIKKWLKEVGE
ncbi:MAG: tetratricopeptide repeat protein [bacterium]|nr:tetratricopeptide repeat protein [bacterium]